MLILFSQKYDRKSASYSGSVFETSNKKYYFEFDHLEPGDFGGKDSATDTAITDRNVELQATTLSIGGGGQWPVVIQW